jgi:hypothetical protein
MKRPWTLVGAALVLLVVASASAGQPFAGTVLRVDPGAGVIVFQDGRMVQTTADSVILSQNQRVALGTLAPGAMITVYDAYPVAMRDGRYVVMGPNIATAPLQTTPPAVAIVPPPAPPAVVVSPPPPAVAVVPSSPMVTTTPSATVVNGQPVFEVSGTVARTDLTSGVIALTDGRKIHTTADTQVLAGNAPVEIDTLQPGTFVTVRSVHPFAGQSGFYSTMQPVASGTVARVDRGSAIVLSDGRVISTSPNTVVMLDNRPVAPTTVAPGANVVIYDSATGQSTVIGPGAAAASPPLLYPGAGLREHQSPFQGGR